MVEINPTPRDIGRLWSKVNKDGPVIRQELGPCWIWTGIRIHNGYGLIWLGGAPDGTKRRSTLVHRASWVIHNGPILGRLQCCHRCDNPPCVRPDHLFLGTNSENQLDRVAKGRPGGASGDRNGSRIHPERCPRGSKSGLAKLTEERVREIKQRLAADESRYTIAAHFGVSYWTIGLIDRGRTWQHVD